MSQNTHGKTIRLLTVPSTLVLYSQRNAFVFSQQFWVAAAPFEHSSSLMLPVFTKYIPEFYGDISLLWKIHRSYLFVLICVRFRNHRALPPLPSEKLLQCSFWRFAHTRPIVRPRLRTHFADTLNSQLMHTVQLLIIKGGLTLISESMVSFADSPFKILLLPPSRFLDPWRYCIQCVQNGEYSGGTESFVGVSRQKQHLRTLCGTIYKCELNCLSKRSRHFIDQQIITFHTFWDLISPHRKKTP